MRQDAPAVKTFPPAPPRMQESGVRPSPFASAVTAALCGLVAGSAIAQGDAGGEARSEPAQVAGQVAGDAQAADSATSFAGLGLSAPRAQAWTDGQGIRRVWLRGLPVAEQAAAAGAGGDVRLTIGRRTFAGREALVELWPREDGGLDLRAALSGARSVGSEGGRVNADRPLQVTAVVGSAVDLAAASFRRGEPSPAEWSLLAETFSADRLESTPPRRGQGPAQTPSSGEERLAQARAAEVAAERASLFAPPDDRAPLASGRLADDAAAEAREEADRPPVDPGVLPASGVVSFDAPRITAEPAAGGGTALTMQGGVRLQHEDLSTRSSRGRVVTLAAERAVVFLAADEPAGTQPAGDALDASGVAGVYLEGAVQVSDGDLAVRGSRVYYDVAGNRAVLLDAVLYRVDPGQDTPLYVRAEVLRQTAQRSFSAEEATLTTTSFAEPAIAIGVDRLDVRGYETRRGREGFAVDARGLTLEAGGVPVFWLPRVAGRGTAIPLRSVSAGFNENDGVQVRTLWDGFGLLGIDAPENVDAGLTLGVRGDRGFEAGLDLRWQSDDDRGRGFLRTYVLPNDNGEDNLPSRPDPQQDGEFRGHLAVGHRQKLANATELTLEAQTSSDPTFYEAFFRDLAYAAPADEAAAFLQTREGDTSASLLVSTRIDDFVGQLVPLVTRGHTVDRLPEASLRHVGRSLSGQGRTGGRVLWFQETTASVLRANFGDDTPGDRSFLGTLGPAVFGVDEDQSFEDAAAERGFPTDAVTRFDSRQELQAPVPLGPVTAVPFVVGRVTAYDTDFDEFNQSAAGEAGESDSVRAWGQAGLRLSARGQRTLSNGRLDLLDLDGLRHVIEPHLTGAYAWTSLEAERLPVFDPLVEDLAEGGQLAIGVRNTLQTRRGPRHSRTLDTPTWNAGRTVDWLVVDTTVVLQEEERRGAPGLAALLARDDSAALIGRFDDQRPETARGGNFLQADARWLVTDSLGLAGELIQSLDDGTVPLWRLGAQLQQTPRFSLRAGYTRLQPLDSELLEYGFQYRFTEKYSLAVEHTLDLGGSARRFIDVDVERRLPQFSLRASARFDELRDDTSFGFALVPRSFR